jgi:hypothetical protein
MRIIIAILICFATGATSADSVATTVSRDELTTVGDVLVPRGVVYKLATDEENSAARVHLASLFSADAKPGQVATTLKGGPVILGPCMWKLLQLSPEELRDKLPTQKVEVIAPVTSSDRKTIVKQKMPAGMIKTPADADGFWAALVHLLKDDQGKLPKPVIRKLTPEELALYWFSIPYDIEEPVFIVEMGEKHILVDLDDKHRAVWIENAGDCYFETASIWTNPADGKQYVQGQTFEPKSGGKERPQKGRVRLKETRLLTDTDTIEKNLSVEETVDVVNRIEAQVADATEQTTASYELLITVTLSAKEEPAFGMASQGEAPTAELEAIQQHLRKIKGIHTKTDEVKVAVHLVVGTPE